MTKLKPKSIEGMNAQQVFDWVIEFLADQGEKSLSGTGDDEACQYRTERGLACAVGACIPDDLYIDNMENYDPEQLYSRYSDLEFGENVPLLFELQNIHDYMDINMWSTLFCNMAKNFHLNDTAVKEFMNTSTFKT